MEMYLLNTWKLGCHLNCSFGAYTGLALKVEGKVAICIFQQ